MRKGQQHSRAEAQACLLWSDRQGAENSANIGESKEQKAFLGDHCVLSEWNERAREQHSIICSQSSLPTPNSEESKEPC